MRMQGRSCHELLIEGDTRGCMSRGIKDCSESCSRWRLLHNPMDRHVECLPCRLAEISNRNLLSMVHCWVFEENLMEFLPFATTFETPLIAEESANGILARLA